MKVLKKIGVFLLIFLCTSLLLDKCNFGKESDNEILKSALITLEDKLEFTQEYAGRVNLKGSRKFDDSFVTVLRTCLDNLDIDYEELEKEVPGVKNAVDELRVEAIDISNLLITMGVTNSDRYVNDIKNSASNTLIKVRNLMIRL